MRIIAGQRRGKRLFSPSDRSIRPTADRLRESVFNILAGRAAGAAVLDLFAGTGAMGIEALSRGAASACFVDHSTRAVALIRRNLAVCGFVGDIRVLHGDACQGLAPEAAWPVFDLVFMDPPYDRGLVAPALEWWVRSKALAPEALIVVEHAHTEVVPSLAPPWQVADQRRYGKTLVSFLNRML